MVNSNPVYNLNVSIRIVTPLSLASTGWPGGCALAGLLQMTSKEDLPRQPQRRGVSSPNAVAVPVIIAEVGDDLGPRVLERLVQVITVTDRDGPVRGVVDDHKRRGVSRDIGDGRHLFAIKLHP